MSKVKNSLPKQWSWKENSLCQKRSKILHSFQATNIANSQGSHNEDSSSHWKMEWEINLMKLHGKLNARSL